uniref:Uncharacterized protein n=1 Tax=Panagrolaimus sp. ES5 TaxID=591445 RepID=A0AC34F1P6_9BILA
MNFFSYAPDNQNFRTNNFYYFIGTWKEYIFAYKKEGDDFIIYVKKIVDAGDWKIFVNCNNFFTLNYKHNCMRSLPVATCIDGSKILIVASDMADGTPVMKVYAINIPDKEFSEYETVNGPGIHQVFFCSNCFQCYIIPDPNEPGHFSIMTWSPQNIKPINNSQEEEAQARFLYLRFKIEKDTKTCTFLKAGLPRLHSNLDYLTSNLGLLNKDAIIYAMDGKDIIISNFGDESWFALESFKFEISHDSDLTQWKQIAFIQGDIQTECIVKENPNNAKFDEINAYTFTIDMEKMKIKFIKKQSICTTSKVGAFANFCTTRILSTPNVALFMPYYSKLFTKVQRTLSLSEICYLTLSGCKSDGSRDIARPQHVIKRLIRLPKNYALVKSNEKSSDFCSFY